MRAADGIRVACAVLVVACSLDGGNCQAHQKWLLPNFFVAANAPVWLSFDVTWSDEPFTAERGIGEQPLWVVHPGGRRDAPPQVFVGKTKSVAEVELTQPGTYRLEAIDPLTYWTRIEQDGRERWLRRPKNEVGDANIIRSDLYWSKAKAYVTVGEPTDLPPPDDSEPLDLRPAAQPNRLAVGQTLELRVVSYGEPVAGAEIQVFGPGATGHDPTHVIRSGEDGSAAIELEIAGRHLLTCQWEQEVADDPKADIHSFNVYLAVEIQPRPE